MYILNVNRQIFRKNVISLMTSRALVLGLCFNLSGGVCGSSDPQSFTEKDHNQDGRKPGSLMSTPPSFNELEIPTEMRQQYDASKLDDAYSKIIRFTAITIEHPLSNAIKKGIDEAYEQDSNNPTFEQYYAGLKQGAWEDWRIIQGSLRTLKERDQKFVQFCIAAYAFQQSHKLSVEALKSELDEQKTQNQKLQDQNDAKDQKVRELEAEIYSLKAKQASLTERQPYWTLSCNLL